MLEVTELTKNFSGLTAISGVRFSIEPGKIVGLVGPNGAGKTTLFSLISGVLQPTRGRLRFNGVPLNGLKPHQVCHLGIARTFQDPRPFPMLTASDFVRVARWRRKDSAVRRPVTLVVSAIAAPAARNGPERFIENVGGRRASRMDSDSEGTEISPARLKTQ